MEDFNSQEFSREETEQGLHLDFIKCLIDMTLKSNASRNDMHIWFDGETFVVDWTNIPYKYEFDYGSFRYVKPEDKVVHEYHTPYGETVYLENDDEYNDYIAEYEKNLNKEETETSEKIILDFLKQLCLNQDNYLNAEFDADGNKLYIDGSLDYPDEKTKKIIKNWLEID